MMIWLAAIYHFPSTYSCRYAMSSLASVQAVPTPGPGTIRLALIRTAIEVFGIDYTRDMLFTHIVAAKIAIRPPDRIAMTLQNLRVYKASEDIETRSTRYDESIAYREVAQADGPMIIYIQVPKAVYDHFRQLLLAIGYWGQANSFTQCLRVDFASPLSGECAMPLRDVSADTPVQHLVTGFVTEFRSSEVAWCDVVDTTVSRSHNLVLPELYVWPLQLIEQHHDMRLMLRHSILKVPERE